jgi:hypothetical protein
MKKSPFWQHGHLLNQIEYKRVPLNIKNGL